MAGLFGLFSGAGDRASKPCYSIENLQHLYNRLQHIKDADEQNRDAMVEVIRQITEALIWGEQNGHDNNFFDFFCEKNILADFVRVLGLQRMPKNVKVQLLQTLSMLVQNIRRDTSVYYLFSNNYVNQLISTQFDWNDEEILGYYISFVKSLAMRLNGETIKFFFNERAEQFPMYIEAVRFFGHRDQMVRTAVRTLTLQVYSVADLAMRKFVLERSWRTYFVHLACHLRELWLRLDAATERVAGGGGGEQAVAALQEAAEEQQDLLMYISDIMGLEVPLLGEALAERVLQYAVFPVLLGSLLVAAPAEGAAYGGGGSGGSGNAAAARDRLSPLCALFVLHQVFDACGRSPLLLEPLAAVLLLPRLSAAVVGRCLDPLPPRPETYQATAPDVSGPSSAEAGAVGPLRDGASEAAPGDSGAPGLRTIVARLISEASPSASDASDASGALGASGASAAGASPAATAAAAAGGGAGGAGAATGGGCEVSVRSRFLAHLGSSSDTCVLLAAGVLCACLICRKALPQALLAEAGLAPPRERPRGRGATGSQAEAAAGSSHGSGGGAGGAGAGGSAEVLLLVVQALEHHSSLRIVVVQALVRLALDLAAEAARLEHGVEPGDARRTWQAAPLLAARHAVRSAARHVRSYLQGALSDSFLDIFIEDWDLFCAPPLGVREACSSIRCLQPPAVGMGALGGQAEWSLPASHSERQHAVKAVRCLLAVRRLHVALPSEESAGGGAGGGAADGALASPLHVPEEVADSYQEQMAFELGRQDRIVCAVATPEGRHTRYLVLHPHLLLLVQPDLVSPGWAVVRTLAPVRAVASQIDRNDPRTLRLSIRLARGAPCPSEASPYDPTGAEAGFRLPTEEHQGNSFFMLTLSFEDVKRCHCADLHLRRRRQEVRSQLRRRVEAFVDALCS